MSRRLKSWAPCADCGTETLSDQPGVPTEYYMVHDHVWNAAGMAAEPALSLDTFAEWKAHIRKPRGRWLCIGCLEARLGRQLHRGDFTAVPINDLNYHRPEKAWCHRSQRLLDRLTAPSPQDGIQLALWDAP